MGLPLITLAEYKTFVGKASPADDGRISALIPAVSELVKTICRRSFIDYVGTAKVEVHNGGFENLLTKEYPILEVVSVEESLDKGVTYSPFTDYVIDYANDQLESTQTEFTRGTNRYKVTYKAGFSTLPNDLKLAVMDLLTYYLKNDSSVHSTKAPGTNSVQIEYITSSALPAHIKRVLDLYVADYL